MRPLPGLWLAASWALPAGLLASSVAARPLGGPFAPLFAVPVWLLAGCVGLGAAWFARDAGLRVGASDVRAFTAPLLALGLMPPAAALAWMGVLRAPGVDAFNLGQAVAIAMVGAGVALFALALGAPSLLRRSGRAGIGAGVAAAAGAWAVTPVLPPFLAPEGPTALHHAAYAVLAVAAFACSLPLWRHWARSGGRPTALFAAGVTLIGFALLANLLRATPTEAPTAWFGRVASLAAAFLFLAGTLVGERAPEPASPPDGALAPAPPNP